MTSVKKNIESGTKMSKKDRKKLKKKIKNIEKKVSKNSNQLLQSLSVQQEKPSILEVEKGESTRKNKFDRVGEA